MKCQNCSAQVDLDNQRGFGFCTYCGQRIVVPESMKQTGETVDGMLTIAEMSLKSNDLQKASEYIDKALEKDTINPYAWLIKGNILMANDNFSGALNSWERALSALNEKEDVKKYLDEIAASLGKFQFRFSRSLAFGEIKEINVELSEATKMILAIKQGIDVPPAYLDDKMLDIFLKNEAVYDTTDLFYHFAFFVSLASGAICGDFDCRNMLDKTKKALRRCKEYSARIKSYKMTTVEGKVAMDSKKIAVIMDECIKMFNEYERVFEVSFSKLSDRDIEIIKEHWMNNRSERLDAGEKVDKVVSELYDGIVDKALSWKGSLLGSFATGKTRKNVTMFIENFAEEITRPAGK